MCGTRSTRAEEGADVMELEILDEGINCAVTIDN